MVSSVVLCRGDPQFQKMPRFRIGDGIRGKHALLGINDDLKINAPENGQVHDEKTDDAFLWKKTLSPIIEENPVRVFHDRNHRLSQLPVRKVTISDPDIDVRHFIGTTLSEASPEVER